MMKLLTLAAVVLCAASGSLAQSSPSWARLRRVNYIRSETRRDRALEKVILQSLPDYSEEIRRVYEYNPRVVPAYLVRYFYNHVDLNDDGKSETIVWLHSAMVGGSSGYTAQIYRKVKGEYRLLREVTPAWNPVIVSNRKTRGWRNLIMFVAGGGVLPGYWTEVRFNGETYPDDPREGVEVRKSRVAGRAYIADDWWTGFKGIELHPPAFKAGLRSTPNRQHNNGMHPTADTPALMYINRLGRRVMPGVSWLAYTGRN